MTGELILKIIISTLPISIPYFLVVALIVSFIKIFR
jgi:hypothetical protein